MDSHQLWPEMKLVVAPASGHSHYDTGLMSELLRATDEIRDTNRVADP